ncbi:MAG TPA: TonB-dependent receptor [Terriglobia bacterium]|nr:TonB-dependent receptor [Terriglobia bacterium]
MSVLIEQSIRRYFVVMVLLLWIATAFGHEGQVRFGEAPIPGAAVQATRGAVTQRAITDTEGHYSLPGVTDGAWTIRVSAPGFETMEREVAPGSSDAAATLQWDLKMLSIEGLQRATPSTGFAKVQTPILQPSDASEEAADRLLINGTVSNAASSQFGLPRAVGNNRAGGRSPYNGNVSFSGTNALLDARSFSLTGQDTPKPDYNRLQSTITLGGPFQIPGLFRNGSFTVSYARTQNRDASVETALMPTAAERLGELSGTTVPTGLISPQARTLLDLYPLPNFEGSSVYNYQIPIVGATHGDNIQGNLNNFTINAANRLSGNGGYQNTRSDDPDLFGFTDTGRSSTVNATLTWNRRITQRIAAVIRYQFNLSSTANRPYFANRIDVSGIAGISGNDRDPRNWGPPALNFSSGIARLSSGTYSFDRNLSHLVSYSSTWIRGRHGFTYGADYRRQQFNLYSQQDPRGSFTFTAAATESDFANFLLGVPTASAIAYGNADKYFRQSFASGFITDDWKVRPSITLTLGARWEYESPIVEKYGRLVNLDIPPSFASATPVVASPSDSLIRTDKTGVQPRLGLAWRPRATSSLIVRAGYGLYRDTAVYRSIANQMAQQAPLSRSLSVQNTLENPLTLADGFKGSSSVSATTFAVDPDFRVGTAQNWTLSIQQDLPAAMQFSLSYIGVKGTHVPQRILPNTYPYGTSSVCAGCPTGFAYLMSGGSSNRHAGTVEVRRRQRNGFQASVQYTYAKAIDDAGLGGNAIAQNWLDRKAERALSNFDQRHVIAVQGQYTSGSFTRVGFWDGWRGKLFREWTLTAALSAGSGSPLTPVILFPVRGTGITGPLRPNVTGAPLYVEQNGGFLSAGAFEAPELGQFGNAGRNSITGPAQFSLNASLTRTFRINERVNVDLRVDANNVLNKVTFPDWNTTVNSSQFGLPTRANAMRSLQPTLRVRF